MSAIITNANRRVGLYSIRSLGKAGIHVAATESKDSKKPVGFLSKYCKESFWTPPPENENEFVEFMLKLSEKYDVLIPCLTDTMVPISKHLEEFEKVINVPVLEYERLKNALDKGKTFKIAEEEGIPIPFTFVPKSIGELDDMPKDKFPMVIKLRTKHAAGVKYVNSPQELKEKYLEMHKLEPYPLVQEFIPGRGVGFHALINKDGKVLATFAHRRIREYPITGGISAFCESIKDPKLSEYGLRLLKAMEWYGIAMVEFRVDERDGIPKLMEINPRFWGSMALPIQAGVNFPLLVYKMALGEEVKAKDYEVGVKTRFLFTDLLACYQSLKAGNIKAFYDFIQPFFDGSVKDGVLSFDDLNPSLHYLLDRIKNKVRRSKRGA